MTLVEMPTVAQAAKVATATGWEHLPAKEEGGLSRRLDAGDGFEAGREAVEAVSVLFKLYRQGAGPLVEVPSGWAVTARKFEVEWPRDPSLVRSHFGGRRFAYNWALDRVKADMDAREQDPKHHSAHWDLASLRKEWNRAKVEKAPWWAENSKEAYSSGIADLVTALSNWRSSKDGARKGRKVGFPKFKSRNRDQPRTGSFYYRGNAAGGRPPHYHGAGDRRAALERKHPRCATPANKRLRAAVEHDSVRTVGTAVRGRLLRRTGTAGENPSQTKCTGRDRPRASHPGDRLRHRREQTRVPQPRPAARDHGRAAQGRAAAFPPGTRFHRPHVSENQAGEPGP